MLQLPNFHSWPGDLRITMALFCVVWMFSAPAVAANANDVGMVGSGAGFSAPANAALELKPVSQLSMPKVDAEPLDSPVVEDPPPVTRENILIRRGGQTQEAGALSSDLPWYRSGLASLGLVLAMITVVAMAIKRVAKTSRGGGGSVLQVLTRTHLSPKQSIAVVQMGGRLVFVGITPEQINMLRIVEDREEAALLRGQLRIDDAQLGGMAFDKHLSREAKELADGLDIGVEASCGTPNQQSGTKEDIRRLLDRLRDFQGGRSHRPSAKGKLTANS